MCNPSNCEGECDKPCDVGEYLEYKRCKCRKRLVDNLVEQYNENIDEKELHPTEFDWNKMIYNSTLNDYEKIYSSCEQSSCTIYMHYTCISISISNIFIYFHLYLKRKHIEIPIYWMQLCRTCKWEILSKLISKIIHITFLMTWSILKTLIQA